VNVMKDGKNRSHISADWTVNHEKMLRGVNYEKVHVFAGRTGKEVVSTKKAFYRASSTRENCHALAQLSLAPGADARANLAERRRTSPRASTPVSSVEPLAPRSANSWGPREP
jgi:hypothetical protein